MTGGKMKFHKECVNCCQTFESSLIINEIITECPSVSSGGRKFEAKRTRVKSVLSNIFKLDYLAQLPPISTQPATEISDEDEDEVAVCDECAKSLTPLFKFYETFCARRQRKSYLHRRIDRLQGIFNEIQLTWSQMEFDDHSSDPQKTKEKSLVPNTTDAANKDKKKNEEEKIIFKVKVQPGNSNPLQSQSMARPKSDRIRDRKQNFKIFSSDFQQLADDDDDDLIEITHVTPMTSKANPTPIQNFENEKGDFVKIVSTSSLMDTNYLQGSPPAPSDEEEPDDDPLAAGHADQAGSKTYTCDLCSETDFTAGEWVDHVESHVTQPVTCPICKKVLSHPWYMKAHLNSHIGNRPFACQVPGCERTYPVINSLRRHIVSAHGDDNGESITSGQPQFTIEVEDDSGSSKGLGPFVAKKKVGRPLGSFKKMLPKKRGRKPKNFVGVPKEERKILIGPKGKIYPRAMDCPTCSRPCPSSQALKIHMRVHTGERPFKCPMCHYRAAQSNNLTMHITRVHRLIKTEGPP